MLGGGRFFLLLLMIIQSPPFGILPSDSLGFLDVQVTNNRKPFHDLTLTAPNAPFWSVFPPFHQVVISFSGIGKKNFVEHIASFNLKCFSNL